MKFFDILIEKYGLQNILIFLIAICYLFLFLVYPPIFWKSFLFSLDVFLKILPILLFVFITMFIFNLFLDLNIIKKFVGKESGWKGWLVSILVGILSSGPIYLWYPLVADLREKGMRTSLVSCFLYKLSVKSPLFPLMIFYFGLGFTIIFNLLIIAFSIISGLIVEKLVD